MFFLLFRNNTLFKYSDLFINMIRNAFDIKSYKMLTSKIHACNPCLLESYILNSLQLRTLIRPLNIIDSSITDESFINRAGIWRKKMRAVILNGGGLPMLWAMFHFLFVNYFFISCGVFCFFKRILIAPFYIFHGFILTFSPVCVHTVVPNISFFNLSLGQNSNTNIKKYLPI